MPYINFDTASAVVIPGTMGAPATGGVETLDSLSTELLSLLGGRSDIDPPRLATWINEAYQGLAAALDLPEFHVGIEFETTPASGLYLAPTRILRTSSAVVRDTVNYSEGGTPLRKTDLDSFRRLHDETGEPERYFFRGRYFVLWPTPRVARTVVVDAYIAPQRMTDPDHSPLLGEEWMEVLKARARATAFSALLEFNLAGQAQNEYIVKLREKQDQLAQERTGMVAGFRPARRRRDQIRGHHTREDW